MFSERPKSNFKETPKWVMYILMAGVALAVILAVLAHFLVAPFANEMPKAPPQESNRIYDSAGFSIVKPDNWNADIDHGVFAGAPPSLIFRPIYPTNFHPHPSPSLEITKLLERPSAENLKGMQESQLQGQPCWKVARRTGGKRQYDSITILSQRGSDWFLLRLSVPAGAYKVIDGEIPEVFQKYLDTFSVGQPNQGN